MPFYKIYKFIYTLIKLKMNHVTSHYKVIGNSFYINNKRKDHHRKKCFFKFLS